MESDEEECDYTAGHYHIGNLDLFPLDQYRLTDPCSGRKCLVKAMCRVYCEEKIKNVNFRRYAYQYVRKVKSFYTRVKRVLISRDPILTTLNILLFTVWIFAIIMIASILIRAIMIGLNL